MFFRNRVINIGRHTLLKMIIGVQFLRCGVVFAFGGDAARVNGPIVEFDRFKLKLFQLGDVGRSVGIVAQAKVVGTEILAGGRFEFDRQGLVGKKRGLGSTI